MESVSSTKPMSCDDWPLLSHADISSRLADVPLWTLIEEDGIPKLERTFISKNFITAMEFIQAVGVVAESCNHHPDIHITQYRNVRLVVYSHGLRGLTDNDFNLAKAIDKDCVATYSPKWLKDNSQKLGQIKEVESA